MIALLDDEPDLENDANCLKAFTKCVFSDVVTLLDMVKSNMKGVGFVQIIDDEV